MQSQTEKKTAKPREPKPGEAGGSYPCLHATRRGRLFHCAEFRRFVVDFKGAYLVLRHPEFRRLLDFLGRLLACRWSCARLELGERIRLRDALGDPTLLLDLADIMELADLMAKGEYQLRNEAQEDLWQAC